MKNLCFDYHDVPENHENHMLWKLPIHACYFYDSKDRRVSSLLHTEAALRASLRPAYLELFALIPRMEGGLRTLISLREDLLVSIMIIRVHEKNRRVQ